MIFAIAAFILAGAIVGGLSIATYRDWRRGGYDWPISLMFALVLALATLIVAAVATSDTGPAPGCYRITSTTGAVVVGSTVAAYGGRTYEVIPCPS